MSFKPVGFPTQKTVYPDVDNGNQPINLDYIQRQSNLLKSQNQPYQGHISNHLEPVPSDNLIQQTRYQLDAPSTRYNTNKLDNTRKMGSGAQNKDELQASEIFSGPNQEYNPYIDYLTKKGLLNDNYKSRIKTTYLNIDSRARSVAPTISKQNDTLLETDSLYYIKTDSTTLATQINLLNINIPNNNFKIGDRITIANIQSNQISVKALYGYDNLGENTDYYSVIFQENSNNLIIKTDFDTSISFSDGIYVVSNTNNSSSFSSFDPNFKVGDGISYDDLKNYDTSDMFVTLSGFIGEIIGNIQTNFLNSTHRVFLTSPDGVGEKYINIPNGNGIVTKITGFYIELPSNFNSNNTDKTPLPKNIYSDMVINMDFQYIGGIAINSLNSDIPITNNNINGYQTIVARTTNTISIQLNKNTYYIEPTPSKTPEVGQQPIYFGGDSVIISQVSEIIGGYPEQNNYIIELPQSIHNIFMIKLASTVFPNTSRTFQNQKNNKIYWQNIDDGDIIYSATVNEGNYNPIDLKSVLETTMYEVTRNNIDASPINYFYRDIAEAGLYPDSDLNNYLIKTLPKNGKVNKGGYTNRVLFVVSIDQNTNITSFTSYKEANLRRPIITIINTKGESPPTQADANDPVKGAYEPPYTIKIVHPKHGLSINDKILLSGFITTQGVPDVVLNTTQTISNISSDDTYEIIVDNFNLSLIRNNEYGGYSAKVYVPNNFRLLFNQPDTMGKQLGFRNVGSDIAITKYGTTITNQQAYQNEILIFEPPTGLNYVSDGSGKQIVLRNNSLRFSGEDYIYLVIREFGGSINISQNKKLIDYFAKINLSGLPGKILYDTHVSVPIIFYDMIHLQQLSVQIYGSDGNLYDFNGIDHSYVLEITSLNLLPQETGINSTSNFI